MYVTVPDEAQIVEGLEIARRMHAESLYSWLPFDVDKVIEECAIALDSPQHLLLVAVDDSGDQDQIVGFFLGYWTEYFFNRERVAEDKALYVSPCVRGGKAATLLINAFRDWAFAEACMEAVLAHSTGYDAGPFFERLGFKRVGTVHKLRLED